MNDNYTTYTDKYGKQVTDVFRTFLNDKNEDALLSALRKLDTQLRQEINGHKDCCMWWRFFANDTGATTGRDIINMYNQPRNRDFIIECMQIAIDDNSVIIYFS